jgi:hypothetical protein
VCADAGLAVRFRPGFDASARRIGHLVPASQPYATAFSTRDVRSRRSARGPYQPGRLGESLLAELSELAAPAEVRQVPCRDLIRPLQQGDRHLFGAPPVVRELRQWLRLSPRHPRYDQDGLSDRALNLSRAEALALAAVLARPGYAVLRRAGLPGWLAAASGGLLDYEGDALVLVAPPRCGPAGQVTMGRVLLRLWLTLSGLGYANHPLSQIIDCAATRDGLALALDVDTGDRLLHVARVGHPAGPLVASARRR